MTMLRGLTLFALLCAVAVAGAVPVSIPTGFTVVTGSSVWTFSNQTTLTTFEPQLKLSLPFAALNQSAMSAAAGRLKVGGFLVISNSTVALGRAKASIKGSPPFGYDVIHNFGATKYSLVDIFFVNNTEQVSAVGLSLGEQRNVTFFHSTNAGKTWTVTEYGPAGLFHSASLAFQNGHGIAVEGSRIFRTLDYGKVWAQTSANSTEFFTKAAIHDHHLSVVFGRSPQLAVTFMLKSHDSGHHWQAGPALPGFTPTSADVTGFVFLNASNWVLTTSGGEIWRSVNSGEAWNRTFAPLNVDANATDNYWNDIAYQSHWGVLMAVGRSTIAVSTDDGLNWTESPVLESAGGFVKVVPDIARAMRPKPQPRNQDDDGDSVGLALGLVFGLGGGLLLIGGAVGFYVYRRYYQPRFSYSTINS